MENNERTKPDYGFYDQWDSPWWVCLLTQWGIGKMDAIFSNGTFSILIDILSTLAPKD